MLRRQAISTAWAFARGRSPQLTAPSPRATYGSVCMRLPAGEGTAAQWVTDDSLRYAPAVGRRDNTVAAPPTRVSPPAGRPEGSLPATDPTPVGLGRRE